MGGGILAALLLAGFAQAQGGREERPDVDPYTKGEPKAMAALGESSFGPFQWNGQARTELVEDALGGVPILWVETEHFRIGSTLEGIGMPPRREDKKALREELAELAGRLKAIPKKPKRLDPWLRLHLFAARLERLYADFEARFGLKDEEFPSEAGAEPFLGRGKYLGLETRYRVFLFQKGSSLARYTQLYCGAGNENSFRFYDQKLGGFFFGIANDALEGDYASDRGLTYAVYFGVAQCLMDGFRGYDHRAPLWVEQGIPRWFARAYEPRFLHYTAKPGEAVRRDEKDARWPQKVRARVEHEIYPSMEELYGWTSRDQMGLTEHVMAWSRVDYLLALGPETARKFLMAVEKPVPWGGKRDEKIAQQGREAIPAATGMDLAAFDAAWAAWVVETYPKK